MVSQARQEKVPVTGFQSRPLEEFNFANPSRRHLCIKFTEKENWYNDVLQAFKNHFIVGQNVAYERATFVGREQREEKGVEEFVSKLHQLAELCNFRESHDEMIQDQAVVGIRD
ncbi:hypothetical protein MRX96_014125 [Rhipicephalus microplus]